MGGVCQWWTLELGDFKTMTVLMDRAVYVVAEKSAPWDEVRESLSSGMDPGLRLGVLIRLRDIERLELRERDGNVVDIAYWLHGRLKRRCAQFESLDDQDSFLAAMERQLGSPLVRQQTPMDVRRAIMMPAVLLIILSVLTVGGMLLSSHWIAHPPVPLRETGKQDELVQFLTWAKPAGILLAGGVPCMIVGAWLLFRALRPPEIVVLKR